jgi:hypothetical protein
VVRMRTRISDEGNSVGDVTGFALRLVGNLIKKLRLITDNVWVLLMNSNASPMVPIRRRTPPGRSEFTAARANVTSPQTI